MDYTIFIMKKRIGLIGLLAAGASALTLAACGSEADPQVRVNQAEIAKAQKEITTLKESLDASKKSLEEAVANLNKYLKIEQISANGDAIASLEAKIKELQDASNTSINDKVDEIIEALEAKADKDALTEAINNFNQAVGTKAEAEALNALENAVDNIKANYATNEALNNKVAELEATLAAKADLEQAIGRIKAIEDALASEYVKSSDYQTAIDKLNGIDLSFAESLVDIDSDIASIKDQITALETAKATVEKVEELEKSLNDKTKALQDKLDLIDAEIGSIKLDDNDEIISIQDQINTINEKIGNVYLDQNNEFISLQEQIDEIKTQIGDYSNSNELKELKADLVYKLSDSYATFQDEMAEIRVTLTEKYHKNVEKLFLEIQKQYNHEMTGSLYKGITLITLAKDAEEAKATEAHYEILINNYINPAKFELKKELDLEIIKAIDERIDIPSGYNNQTIREKLTAEVEAVKWFDDDKLEEFVITKEDDDQTQKAKSVAYKEATQELIDLMDCAVAKGETIDAFLEVYNTVRTSINTKLADDAYQEAKTEFISILDEEIYDLDEYYNCKNIDIEIIEINPSTNEETKHTINDLIDQFITDFDALTLVEHEVDDYLSLDSHIKTELGKVNTGATKLVNMNAKIYDSTSGTTDLDAFNLEVKDVLDYINYAKLNSSILKADEQLQADKALVDLYIVKAKAYDELIKYCNDGVQTVENLLENTDVYPEERNTIKALIGAIHKYGNYITADLVIEKPETTGTDTGAGTDTAPEATVKSVAEQLAEDKFAADLLVQRANTYLNIYNYICANSVGLNSYIDNKTAKVNQESPNLFVADLKTKFKAEYADLIVPEKFDKVIKDFATIKEFTDYETSIIGDGGVLDLIKKNVDTFANILVIDNVAKETINNFTNLSTEYKNAFIDNFKAYATYDTNKDNTKEFATKDAFDTYYTNTVKDKIDNIVKVAQYENSLIGKRNSVDAAINTAFTDEKITEDVKTYLLAVIDNIYSVNTTVTTEKVDNVDKLVTSQTIAADATDAVIAKLQAVEDAITTFYNVDEAALALSVRLDTYKANQKKIFLSTYYKYRDDEEYALDPADVGKYNGFNQAALEAWEEYDDDFDNKIDEITYEYVVPTENITYETFTQFVASLLTIDTIGNRYTGIETWYSLNTEENPKAGMFYTITAKFEELDALKVEDCRTYFIGKLEEYKDALKALVTSEEYKGNLENLFDVNKGSINGEYGKTTNLIITKYEDSVKALDQEYQTAINAYRNTALTTLDTMYNTYCTDNPTLASKFEHAYNKLKTILSANKHTYMSGEDEVSEDWSEEIIDSVLDDAETAFEYIIILDYKDNKLLDIDGLRDSAIEAKPEIASYLNSLYDKYSAILSPNSYSHIVEDKTVEELWTTDIVDTIYAEAEAAFENAYKGYLKELLENKCDSYNNLANSVNTDYIYAAALSNINSAQTDADALAAYNAGDLEMAKDAYLKLLIDYYNENVSEAADKDLFASIYNEGAMTINNATSTNDVESAYSDAHEAMETYLQD